MIDQSIVSEKPNFSIGCQIYSKTATIHRRSCWHCYLEERILSSSAIWTFRSGLYDGLLPLMPLKFRNPPPTLVVSLYVSVPWHNLLNCSSELILAPVHSIQVVLPLNPSVIQGWKHWGWQWLLPFEKDKLSIQKFQNASNLLIKEASIEKLCIVPAINTLRFI